jgi:hypothetical protein
MPPVTVSKQSTINVSKNQQQVNRAVNGMWKIAKKAPMFCKTTKNPETKAETTRYTHLLNGLAYKVAVSGACASVSGMLEHDMDRFGMNINPDSKSLPWTCSMAPGAAFMLEQFLAGVVQQIAYNSTIIRKGLGKHSRNHRSITKLAIEEAKRAIFDPASSVPISTTVLPMILSRKKKAGETEAPGEKEAPDHSAEAEEENDEEGGEEGDEGEEGGEEAAEEEA